MAYDEIPLETFCAAREVTRGTAVTPPTVRFPFAGVWTPEKIVFRAEDEVGTYEEWQRSEVMHRIGRFEGGGSFDVRRAQFLLAMVAKGGVTPTTPGTLSRLWSYVPTITSDDLSSMTAYWGDPNVAVQKSPFTMIDELSVESNSDSDEATSWGVKGSGQWDGAVPLTGGGIPALPAVALGPLLAPQKMQVWIDVASAIGTSSIAGRVVSAKHVIPTGIEYKYPATGPAGGLTFDHIGRNRRHIETTLVLEVPDLTQFNNWRSHDICKVRVRHNGPLIETVATVDYYYYFEVDTYGPLDGFAWGDVKGTNRTIEVMIQSEMNAGIGASWAARVQNISTTEVN